VVVELPDPLLLPLPELPELPDPLLVLDDPPPPPPPQLATKAMAATVIRRATWLCRRLDKNMPASLLKAAV